MKMRVLIAGLIISPLVIASNAQAQATWSTRNQQCAQLEGELARLQRARFSSSSQNFEKYDAAVHQQQAQIDNAMRQAKMDACLGQRGFLFRRQPKDSCPALMKDIEKMQKNLASIEQKRSQYAPPPSDTGPLKAQILRQLAEADCGDQYQQFARIQPQRERRGLFSTLFNRDSEYRVRDYGMDRYEIPQIGTFRTVCVRACDGFFFPVSFSTTESSFQRDAQVCQQSCPGTDAELYVYHNPGESPDEMVSLSGSPYQSLETAYLYKREFVPNCSCQAPAGQMASLSTNDLDLTPNQQNYALDVAPEQPEFDEPSVPLPLPKQSAMVDPDTRALARFGMKFTPYQPPEVSTDDKSIRTADGRSIRLVGPRFFGNQ